MKGVSSSRGGGRFGGGVSVSIKQTAVADPGFEIRGGALF